MTCHDDDRQFATRLVQAFLDRQAVHAGHVDVEQHASPPFFFIRFQKTFGIPINGHTIILDTQQEAQGMQDEAQAYRRKALRAAVFGLVLLGVSLLTGWW